MKNIIIGTAGHIDHGKTALIRVLTGIETDRLKEEKKRGITIDLGFAYLDLPSGERAGIIDVPGHEKFIKNMLAGVGGIDLVLLVIAADEGIMPQTREHLNILSILDIKKGIVVLTKSDLVDEDWLFMIEEDVKDFLKDTFLKDSSIIPVSSMEGIGIERLKGEIFKITDEISQKDITSAVRVPIDRVFIADGFGTVVTGTQVEGSLSVGDQLTLYPDERLVKVKNIQLHGKSVEKSYAGQRVALNLSGVKREEIKRGNVLAKTDSMRVSMLIDAKLNLLDSIPRPLKNRARIRFYHGTSEILGRIILLESEELSEGQSGYVQFRLEEKVALKTGDHFVIRYYSPMDTIGGGVVLDSNPFKHKRFRRDVLEELQIKEIGDFEDILEETIKKFSSEFPTIEFLSVHLGRELEAIEDGIKSLLEDGIITKITDKIFIHADYIEEIRQKSILIMNKYHSENPLKPGIGKEEFRNRIFKKDIGKISDIIIKILEEDSIISASNTIVALKSFKVTLTGEQEKAIREIEGKFRESSFSPPSIDDAIRGYSKQINAMGLVQILFESGALVKIDAQIVLHVESYKEMKEKIKNFIASSGKITLGECRDLLNTSRKYVVPFLEHLDQQKFTRKKDDYRVLY